MDNKKHHVHRDKHIEHEGDAEEHDDASHCESNFEGKTTRFVKQNYLQKKNMSEEERKKWFRVLTNENNDGGSCFRCNKNQVISDKHCEVCGQRKTQSNEI